MLTAQKLTCVQLQRVLGAGWFEGDRGGGSAANACAAGALGATGGQAVQFEGFE